MNDSVTRPEFEARIETIEARIDGRIARIQAASTEKLLEEIRQERQKAQ